jgi:hypothetical protein
MVCAWNEVSTTYRRIADWYARHFHFSSERQRVYSWGSTVCLHGARSCVAWKWTPTSLKFHVLGGHTGLLPSSLGPSDMQTHRQTDQSPIASSTVSQSMESLASCLAPSRFTHVVRVVYASTSIDCAFLAMFRWTYEQTLSAMIQYLSLIINQSRLIKWIGRKCAIHFFSLNIFQPWRKCTVQISPKYFQPWLVRRTFFTDVRVLQ